MAYNGNDSGGGHARASEWKIKELMCDIGRRIWLKGFCAGNEGNHSYRLSENRILCTPTGISKGNLKPEDICTVDLDGKQCGGKRTRTSEILLHLAIYKNRPDIKAVIHSHPPHATAFAVAGLDLPTCIHPEAEVFLGVVKTAKYVTPGDTRLGESIVPYVKDSNTIILQNHGTVSYDADLEQAYYKLEIVDAYARILILAKQLGSIRQLTSPEMTELLQLKSRFGMDDARVKAGLEKMSCAGDFLSRIGDDKSSRGRMACGCSVGPVSKTSSLQQSIAQLAPQNFDEGELEQLVQAITDQIIAAA